MSSSDDTALDAPVPAGAPTPGTLVREAREAAGLSIDDVSQQLKLAPRQVQALEADDYAQLPGRTFVRGFMRNYARLLRLDPDALLAALPVLDALSAGNSPITRVVGEIAGRSSDAVLPSGKATSRVVASSPRRRA